MTEKQDIQIKYLNPETGEWTPLDPKTNSSIVQMNNGQSLETVMGNKANISDVYTKEETYTKTETNTLVENIEGFNIEVSENEPTDNSNFWFELI